MATVRSSIQRLAVWSNAAVTATSCSYVHEAPLNPTGLRGLPSPRRGADGRSPVFGHTAAPATDQLFGRRILLRLSVGLPTAQCADEEHCGCWCCEWNECVVFPVAVSFRAALYRMFVQLSLLSYRKFRTTASALGKTYRLIIWGGHNTHICTLCGACCCEVHKDRGSMRIS